MTAVYILLLLLFFAKYRVVRILGSKQGTKVFDNRRVVGEGSLFQT